MMLLLKCTFAGRAATHVAHLQVSPAMDDGLRGISQDAQGCRSAKL
jgi:hypothetical protein